jgi:hypothetical protein
VSAAGNARHSDELMNRVARFFLKDSSCQQLEPTEQGIEKIVQDFYLNHVAVVPSSAVSGPPEVELIIAAQKNGFGGLYATEKTITTKYDTYAAVGVGAGHAINLLGRLWRSSELDVISTAILAAYVVFHVKEYVDGCGLFTDVTAIQNNGCFYLTRDQVSGLEKSFRSLSENIEGMVIDYLFGKTHDDIAKVSEALKSARAEFMRVAMGAREGLRWRNVGDAPTR